MPERSELFTFTRSDSRQLNTLLKKDVAKVLRQKVNATEV